LSEHACSTLPAAMDRLHADLPAPDDVAAKEATRLLDVQPQTLYAYVSRGWGPGTGGFVRCGGACTMEN
jgi:hypothetical protein